MTFPQIYISFFSFHKFCDVLDVNTLQEFVDRVDVCLDKGTYDAVSLSPGETKEKRIKYQQSVLSLLKDGGLFIIVSCNWTEDELKKHFRKDMTSSRHHNNDSGVGFVAIDTIPSPSFQFGGKTGQTTSTIVFRKM